MEVIDKTNTLGILPDYFLGILRALHVRSAKDTHQCDDMRTISDKIGLIMVNDHGKIRRYSRGQDITNYIGKFC